MRSKLSWTHYWLIVRIDNEAKREYYQLEAANNNWTARQLERQINSHLYERLLLSNDKESVLAVARREKKPVDPTEIIKDPMVLEFLGLKREANNLSHIHNNHCFPIRKFLTLNTKQG